MLIVAATVNFVKFIILQKCLLSLHYVFSTVYNYARCLYEMSGDSHQDFYSLEVTGGIVKLFCLFSVNPVRSIK